VTVAPKGATNAKANGRCGPTTSAAKLALSVPAEIYLNVAISGLLTGLVYGLMALGLSVIFGVVRVVNFAHGEMMTVAMYLAVVLFAQLGSTRS
jgi:ABC-type branched-subunit amino acid transport system permease subunit